MDYWGFTFEYRILNCNDQRKTPASGLLSGHVIHCHNASHYACDKGPVGTGGKDLRIPTPEKVLSPQNTYSP